ncbi:porin [Pararobbsia silviterrae]|uniref:Porin n=1 Tax=Pararobbsia silviterrae TaxID=1792498 RepID=A0A494Y697_9BURK|nr:porin [Pararobbsia silviterrae]RKP55856.1 porin [Pararobbsia silviterrae]
MKKTLLVAALSGAFAVTAHAQSSVTLYGLLDAGIVYSNNAGGHNQWQQGSNALSQSVFGLQGSEDLGAGNRAIFKLESGINVNSGSTHYGNTLFGRQSYVGLSNDQYGTLTLGRQFDSMVDFVSPLSFTGAGDRNALAAHPFDNDNLGASFSTNNSVKYTSANLAGLQFGGQYSFSNATGDFAENRAYSLGASYKNGPLSVGAGYMQLNGAGSNTSGAVLASDNDNAFSAQRQRVWGAGANYTFGPATVGFVWTHTQLDNIGSLNVDGNSYSVGGANLHLDNYELNGRYALTPALSLQGAYTFTDGKYEGSLGNQSPKWQQVSLESDYALSKRTDVYVEGVYQHAADGGGTPFGDAAINTLSPSSTDNQVAATVGLRHRF